jgi:signal transduction histidine kinase
MPARASDPFALLDRARTAVEAALCPASTPAELAANLAAALRGLWPEAHLSAARVEGDAGPAVAALDRAGRPRPDWADGLRDRLAGPAGPAESPPGLDGAAPQVAPAAAGGRAYGALAVALPGDDAAARAVLAACAREAALGLALAAHGRERAALEEELAEREWLADVGEVVGPVTHEFNNFLNTLLLQVAVLDMSAAEGMKAELATMRRQGKEVAAVVKQLQQYRRRRRGEPRPADLNRAAAEAAAALAGRPAGPEDGPRLRLADDAAAVEPGAVRLRLRLAAGLPAAAPSATDQRRLGRFLIGGAAWAVAGGGTLTLATAAAGGGLAVRLEVAGAAPGAVARLLEGPVAGAEEAHGLELAACQSLVRRLGGSLRAEAGPGGGEAVVVELPAARG